MWYNHIVELEEYISTFDAGDQVLTKYGQGTLLSTGTNIETVHVDGQNYQCPIEELLKVDTTFVYDGTKTCWDKLTKMQRNTILNQVHLTNNVSIDAKWHDLDKVIQNKIKQYVD